MTNPRATLPRLRITAAAILALATILLGILAGAATALRWDGLLTPGPPWDRSYQIDHLDVHARVDTDGTLHVTETITATWLEPRRGLIRDIDVTGPAGPLHLDGIDVSSDTQPDVWFDIRTDDVPGHTSVHLGSEHAELPLGTDRYTLTYQLDGLAYDNDGRAAIRWDTFGFDWSTLISRARVSSDPPDGRHELTCVVGAEGQSRPCDTDNGAFIATELRPGRGMTVEVTLDPATLPADGLPSVDLDGLTQTDTLAYQRSAAITLWLTAAAMPLLATFSGPRGAARRRTAIERPATCAPAYAPPPGADPLTLAASTLHPRATQLDAWYAAWLVDAQQRELLQAAAPPGQDLQAADVVTFLPGSATSTDPVEAQLVATLTGNQPQGRAWGAQTPLELHQQRWQAFATLAAARKRASSQWLGNPTSGVPGLAIPAALVAGVAAYTASLLSAGTGPLVWATGGAVVAFLFGVGAHGLVRPAIADLEGETLTRWQSAEGLRRFVTEAHAGQIDGVADDPSIPVDNPFLELLPYVIAFGVGDVWSERFGDRLTAVANRAGVVAPVASSQRRRDAFSLPSRSAKSTSSSSSRARSGGRSGGGGGGGRSR